MKRFWSDHGNRAIVGMLIGLLFLVLMSLAAAQPAVPAYTVVPEHTGYVTDRVPILSEPDRQALMAKLVAYEQRTSNEFAVLIVPTTDGDIRGQILPRFRASQWVDGLNFGVDAVIARLDAQGVTSPQPPAVFPLWVIIVVLVIIAVVVIIVIYELSDDGSGGYGGSSYRSSGGFFSGYSGGGGGSSSSDSGSFGGGDSGGGGADGGY